MAISSADENPPPKTRGDVFNRPKTQNNNTNIYTNNNNTPSDNNRSISMVKMDRLTIEQLDRIEHKLDIIIHTITDIPNEQTNNEIKQKPIKK